MAAQEKLAGLLARHREKILKQWQRELSALTGKARLSAEDTRRQADEFFDGFMSALAAGASADITELLDKLGLYTVKAFQRTREEVINRQQAEMLELSTPVVKLWEGILALPLIGTLDSARTQVVMESG